MIETNKRIEQLAGEIEETHEQSETSQRLVTIPGVGMLSATVIAVTTPDVGNFGSARDYAVWLGLTPKAAFHWRQAEYRQDIEDGQPVHSTIAVLGCHGGRNGSQAPIFFSLKSDFVGDLCARRR